MSVVDVGLFRQALHHSGLRELEAESAAAAAPLLDTPISLLRSEGGGHAEGEAEAAPSSIRPELLLTEGLPFGFTDTLSIKVRPVESRRASGSEAACDRGSGRRR